jgi:hypothetical protein
MARFGTNIRNVHEGKEKCLLNPGIEVLLTGRFLKSWAKFLRLLAAFGAAVWAMRSSMEWIHTGAGFKLLGGWAVLLIASLALGMAVNEEVRRDALRQQ